MWRVWSPNRTDTELFYCLVQSKTPSESWKRARLYHWFLIHLKVIVYCSVVSCMNNYIIRIKTGWLPALLYLCHHLSKIYLGRINICHWVFYLLIIAVNEFFLSNNIIQWETYIISRFMLPAYLDYILCICLCGINYCCWSWGEYRGGVDGF